MRTLLSITVLFSVSSHLIAKDCRTDQIFLDGDCFQTKHYKYMTLANAKGYSDNQCHLSPPAEKIGNCAEMAHTQITNGYSLLVADRKKTVESIQNSYNHRCSISNRSVECIHLKEAIKQEEHMIGVIEKKLELMDKFPDQYKKIYKKCHFENNCPSMGEFIRGLPEGTPEDLKGDLLVVKDSVLHHNMLEAHDLFGASGVNDEFQVDLDFLGRAFGPARNGWEATVIAVDGKNGGGTVDCRFPEENQDSCFTDDGRKYVPETNGNSILNLGRFFNFLGGKSRAPSDAPEETSVQGR